jgi:hypothetical protein
MTIRPLILLLWLLAALPAAGVPQSRSIRPGVYGLTLCQPDCRQGANRSEIGILVEDSIPLPDSLRRTFYFTKIPDSLDSIRACLVLTWPNGVGVRAALRQRISGDTAVFVARFEPRSWYRLRLVPNGASLAGWLEALTQWPPAAQMRTNALGELEAEYLGPPDPHRCS